MARIKTMELLQQVGENIKAAAEKLEIEKSITKAVSTTDSLQVGDRVRIKKRSSYYSNDANALTRKDGTLMIKEGSYWYVKFDGEKDYILETEMRNRYHAIPKTSFEKIASIHSKGDVL